jgi:hypothetical protein
MVVLFGSNGDFQIPKVFTWMEKMSEAIYIKRHLSEHISLVS